MSKKTIVSLNVGSQVISLATFELSQGELSLYKHASTSVTTSITNNALRFAQVKVAIENLVEELNIKKSKVYCAIPNPYGFTKFLKLVQIPREKLEKIVFYEAKQNIPLPLNEVSWGWHHLQSYADLNEVEVVAVRKEDLSEIIQSLTNSAFSIESMQLSHTTLVNSYYYSYDDYEIPTILIDLGALSTSIIYLQEKSHFCRTLTIGGTGITEDISEALDIDFANAEAVKIAEGVLLQEEDLEFLDEKNTASPSQLVTHNYLKIASEVQRTVEYLEREYEWPRPKRILLAGGGASLAKVESFFTKACEIEASLFAPLQNVQMSDTYRKSALHKPDHEMGALVGGALFGGGVARVSTEVVPEVVQKRRGNKRKKPLYLQAFTFVMLSVFGWAGAQYYAYTIAHTRLLQLQGDVNSLEPFRHSIRQLDEKRQALDEVANNYISLIRSRYRAVTAVVQLSDAFDEEAVWIDQIQELVDYQVGDTDFRVYYVSEPESELPSVVEGSGQYINALEVKGYWRDVPERGQGLHRILSVLVNDPQGEFCLSLKGKREALTNLLTTEEVLQEGAVKVPFTMVLPLKAPIPLD